MTLAAAILIFGISSLLSADPVPAAFTPQSQSSAPAPVSQEPTPPPQAEPEATKSSSAQSTATQAPASNPKASTAKKTHPKKKVVPAATCDPPPATSTVSGSNTAPTSEQPGGAQASSTPEAPKNCPPPKVIVKQGGITEQGIQLAGGSVGGDATQKKDAANRMLAATEDNLKKIAGRQLSTAEQDSVSQIRQFVDQSKSALAAANLERAQTLAWKAKLLSDDLVNPQR